MKLKRLFIKLISSLILLAIISVVNFGMFHLSPGDATNRYFAPNTSKQQLAQMRNQLGLNKPLPIQFGIWCKKLIHGDLGYSWSQRRPVADVLTSAIPATLLLTVTALFINFLVGVGLGMVSGIHWESQWGKWIDTIALFVYSIPVFGLGLLSILLFSISLGWLPSGRMMVLQTAGMSDWEKLIDGIRHLILPAAVLGLSTAAGTARYVRGNVQHIIQQNYVRAAYAKGLPVNHIYVRHILRNAMLPVITLLGLHLPYLLSGAFIIEVVFAWPGMGRITYDAVFAKDFPVVMAINLIAAILVISGNFLADLLYKWIDPRVEIT